MFIATIEEILDKCSGRHLIPQSMCIAEWQGLKINMFIGHVNAEKFQRKLRHFLDRVISNSLLLAEYGSPEPDKEHIPLLEINQKIKLLELAISMQEDCPKDDNVAKTYNKLKELLA